MTKLARWDFRCPVCGAFRNSKTHKAHTKVRRARGAPNDSREGARG